MYHGLARTANMKVKPRFHRSESLTLLRFAVVFRPSLHQRKPRIPSATVNFRARKTPRCSRMKGQPEVKLQLATTGQRTHPDGLKVKSRVQVGLSATRTLCFRLTMPAQNRCARKTVFSRFSFGVTNLLKMDFRHYAGSLLGSPEVGTCLYSRLLGQVNDSSTVDNRPMRSATNVYRTQH